MPSRYHLAQLNIARLREPLDSAANADFVAQLAPINALGDAAPGFVWRYQTPEGDATALRPDADDRIILNFSIWESMDALRDFAYRSAHAGVLARRREWFERMTDSVLVLWWVEAGERPTPEAGMAKLELLRRHGATPEAFTFRQAFPAPDEGEGPGA